MNDSRDKRNKEKQHLLRPALFWDIDITTLDPEAHAQYIIGRVVSKGNLSDWNTLKQLYGHQRIRQEVVNLRSLDAKSLNFLSSYYDIDKKLFRCYTLTPLSRKL